MNKKVINILFFLISVCLIFNNIPKVVQMNFIGGGILGNKLVFYPLIVGYIYTAYCQYKYKNVLVNFDKFLKFIQVYLIVSFISLVVCLHNYPYYDLVINASVTQIEKLPKLMTILDTIGININEKALIAFWMIARTLKGLLLEVIYTFGGSYMIYCWYYENWKTGFKILIKSVLLSLIVILVYSCIEVLYLAGNENAKNILSVITPFIHIVNINHGWWPPLLWKNQIRSVFVEPSFFSIWAAFALPFIWYKFFIEKRIMIKYFTALGLVLFNTLIFLTNALTGVALFCGEFACLIIYLFLNKKKFVLKNVFSISLCVLCSFLVSNYFINNFISNKNVVATSNSITVKNITSKYAENKPVSNAIIKNIEDENTIQKYLEKNLTSIFSLKARSNEARYSTIYANVMIGLDNPILGVGKGLVPAYMPDYFPDFAANNREVQNWIKYQNEKGILKMPIPSFCAYSLVFAESGIVGLLCYLFPAFFLIYNILKILYQNKGKLEFAILLIALLGILASGFSNTLNITYCYWVLLGLGYAMCFGKENDVIDNGDTGSKQEH